MSVSQKPQPAFLFTAVLFSEGIDPGDVMPMLEELVGEFLICSRPVDFVWSDYYKAEMGKNLKRIFVVYKNTVQRDEIVKVKKITDSLEKTFMKDGGRTVNIDPGLICLENIILATNKAFFHRIYLTDGVYAEVTMFYRRGTYTPIEYWTYPEYRSTPVIGFFNEVREKLSDLLKHSF